MKIKVLFSALALSALMMDAQAHVTIRNYANGVDSIAGKSDHFRLNVPTNRGKAVTKVKMVVAEGVKLLFVHPMHGWTYTTEKKCRRQYCQHHLHRPHGSGRIYRLPIYRTQSQGRCFR